MALENNMPTFTYVRWTGVQIVYQEEIYTVQNSHSNKKYMYWSINNPYQFEEVDVRKTQKVGEYLIIINDKGISTMPTHTDIKINFDGNNPDLIRDKIFGIYDTVDGMGDRFVSIEQNIDGLSTTVGQIQEEQGSMKQQISEIDQKADEIGLSVKDVEREFAENKEATELRENLNKSIIDFNSNLGIFKTEITGYFKDNKIADDEKVAIDTHISLLNSSRSEVILYVDKVIMIAESEGQSDIVTKLNSAKTKFINAVNNLITYITTAISDKTIVPSEVTAIINFFGNCSTSINALKNTCDEVIFLGAGGSITTELARIGIKSDEILLEVDKNIGNITNSLSLEKVALLGHIKDLEGCLVSLDKSIDDISSDGDVTQAEKQIISEKIESMDKENQDLVDVYIKLRSDINISQSEKVSLESRYNEYIKKYNANKKYINDSILDNVITDIEKNTIKTYKSETLLELTGFHKQLCSAMDDINKNLQQAEIQKAKDELQKEINDVDGKVEDLNSYVDNAFKDSVISHAERKILEEKIKGLDKEKMDVDKKYQDLYNNPDLLEEVSNGKFNC